MEKFSSVEDLENHHQNLLSRRDSKKLSIAICSGTGCHAYASEKVVGAFEEQLQKHNLTVSVDIKRTGCHGFCEKGPIVVIYPHEFCYCKVTPQDVSEIVTQTIQQGKPVERLLYTDQKTGKKITLETEIPFYKNQTRLIFGNNRKIDPKSIDDYIALGGYAGLAKALSKMTPQQVLDEVKKANLRGRGGGGFPAGKKWETTKNAAEEPKYVIVNCDEGDPGAYMDRSLMEGNPHSVLEGLLIGAYAIGAHEGYVYVRQEYPLAVENTEHAIRQAEEHGLLGKNILGSGFDFNIKVHRGAGAFVSGESSALMSAIEGRVGEPRPKYIHTAVSGLWNKPTCLNNVETWANVPFIINNSAQWFASMGTPNSTGTKIFSLVGNVNNTGLVEVPMGITLREIIYTIGGGIPKGKRLKAVQTGGPSGGCIPEKYLDLTIDFDELYNVGSMMGSGGMIVMDEDTCMVDIARYFVNFLAQESCGKCLPCREGLRQMLRILNDITSGTALEEDMELLEELSEVVQMSALCALGQSAPNPILSTLKYFRDEYEAHLRGECPAKVCKALTQYEIDPAKCKGCGLCTKNCSVEAIEGKNKSVHRIKNDMCIKCGNCLDSCKFNAVVKTTGKQKEFLKKQITVGTR
ncbi:MAG TPA: NADH-quinone oxidoreductase subunit F [Thermoplasmata archaeon]|jgi:NADH:ubiquinone oxidoreductase subunit F (NADH-binding)/(2Fe-2S) ferredoxin/NAD-dependent dihydropyrimidine dehydrogenase PreA subunit|nr:MAG TPA: NADH-quinone oxidoreductase subunit F [Thermoplasmata archaeon]